MRMHNILTEGRGRRPLRRLAQRRSPTPNSGANGRPHHTNHPIHATKTTQNQTARPRIRILDRTTPTNEQNDRRRSATPDSESSQEPRNPKTPPLSACSRKNSPRHSFAFNCNIETAVRFEAGFTPFILSSSFLLTFEASSPAEHVQFSF